MKKTKKQEIQVKMKVNSLHLLNNQYLTSKVRSLLDQRWLQKPMIERVTNQSLRFLKVICQLRNQREKGQRTKRWSIKTNKSKNKLMHIYPSLKVLLTEKFSNTTNQSY